MINNFIRLLGFSPKYRSTSLSLDAIWDNARLSNTTISYSEILDNTVIHCADNDLVERALKYQNYLIQVMGISMETSARCTLDLYWPSAITGNKQGIYKHGTT